MRAYLRIMTGSTYADVSAYVRWGFVPALLIIGSSIGAAKADEKLAVARQNMIRVIELHARIDADIVDRVAIGEAVLDAMAEVPRHEFVAENFRSAAYEDRPLPIGHGQTISQPFIVALMTETLELEPDDVVLEIGTGSGYQAAVLAELVREVHTIEIIPALAETAAAALEKLAYDNVRTYIGDGYFGVPEAAPFDGIMVTAAASHVPPPLIEQLKPGARMIIPVGNSFAFQYLMIVEKDVDGRVTTRQTLPVSFVPLTRGE
jgi:protein-L-isoaspartate(D-aspartate) O-methyltransferase